MESSLPRLDEFQLRLAQWLLDQINSQRELETVTQQFNLLISQTPEQVIGELYTHVGRQVFQKVAQIQPGSSRDSIRLCSELCYSLSVFHFKQRSRLDLSVRITLVHEHLFCLCIKSLSSDHIADPANDEGNSGSITLMPSPHKGAEISVTNTSELLFYLCDFRLVSLAQVSEYMFRVVETCKTSNGARLEDAVAGVRLLYGLFPSDSRAPWKNEANEFEAWIDSHSCKGQAEATTDVPDSSDHDRVANMEQSANKGSSDPSFGNNTGEPPLHLISHPVSPEEPALSSHSPIHEENIEITTGNNLGKPPPTPVVSRPESPVDVCSNENNAKEKEERERVEKERIAEEKRVKDEAERKEREEAEENARQEKEREEAEQAAKMEAERKAREEAARKAEDERKAREEDRKIKMEAERKAREERAQKEAEQKAKKEAARKAREEAENRAREERLAMEQARQDEEEAQAKQDAERKARETKLEEERKAREESERNAQEEDAKRKAEELRLKEDMLKAKEEAKRKAREQNNRRLAERKAKREAERKSKEEEEHRVQEELREQMEQEAKAEAERKARAEAERMAKAEEDRKIREENERQSELRRAKRDAERKAKRDARHAAREAEAQKVKELGDDSIEAKSKGPPTRNNTILRGEYTQHTWLEPQSNEYMDLEEDEYDEQDEWDEQYGQDEQDGWETGWSSNRWEWEWTTHRAYWEEVLRVYERSREQRQEEQRQEEQRQEEQRLEKQARALGVNWVSRKNGVEGAGWKSRKGTNPYEYLGEYKL
ncbi:hypothetical protein RSOLAG1IB_05714 [Rhizoctonia solani AG-1 IB]|uniref:Uncharacterized protein n=1 Tax=Thanatephorus cucumeris (strain AG1-IB / isolate 7/3/14) TaxID=1108050 RepID=A0A0B7F4P1_THACB|nr:hypothetical protein RSOLAG1IB_05714 [Rhizoctonia solani AG-1 IB]